MKYQIYFTLKITRRIFNKLGVYRTYPLSVGGKTYKVPIHKGLGYAHFADAEPWMDIVLKNTGEDNFRFLDVGVNIGQTLLKWKAEFPNSVYVGFEPNQNCVTYVNDLIAKNNIEHCTIQPYGISTSKTNAQLYLLGRDPGDSSASTIQNFRKDQERTGISIQLIPLKEIDNKPFDLIKIDVEGSELEVIQSIFEVNGDPIIICEILPIYAAENTERLARQNSIGEILKQNNYVIYRIIKGEKISLIKLNEFDIHGDINLCDYIFMPESKEKAIIANFS